MVKCPTTVFAVDVTQVTRTVCQLLESSNAIIGYLCQLERETGISGGGDPLLRNKVQVGRNLVRVLMHALVCHEFASQKPGMDFCLRYRRDTRVIDGCVMLRNEPAESASSPSLDMGLSDREFRNLDPTKIKEKWHFPGVLHPVVHVPGTQWHKYFGNLTVQDPNQASLFRGKRQPRQELQVTTTAATLMKAMGRKYAGYRNLFHNAGWRDPRGLTTQEEKLKLISKLLKGLSIHDSNFVFVKGTLEYVSPHEGLFQYHRPEYDPFGRVRFEYLNSQLNRRRLSGIALPGQNIPMGVPVHRKLYREIYAPSTELDLDSSDGNSENDHDLQGQTYLDWEDPNDSDEFEEDWDSDLEAPLILTAMGDVRWA
ncbi:hypothetical protein QBC34DRAFT_435175 [Podospora aff. communis PSN243]|uniref:HNH nuclease domain-containing protein n=1 Tax=Podospora aff. communis PSN243 TaxID=3040156 RepID=A0AAV9H026_9PEZI|nr:hypothetical protein QBC34DRAFT_435175 [Podospora aff. communis PSN243]